MIDVQRIQLSAGTRRRLSNLARNNAKKIGLTEGEWRARRLLSYSPAAAEFAMAYDPAGEPPATVEEKRPSQSPNGSSMFDDQLEITRSEREYKVMIKLADARSG